MDTDGHGSFPPVGWYPKKGGACRYVGNWLEKYEGFAIPVVQVEDIIGLKIQASVNDPRRQSRDWSDIRQILESCAESHQTIDWEILGDYLDLFDLKNELQKMRIWYDSID